MMSIHSTMVDMALAFAAGFLIGSFYFLSLWWTVRRLPKARFPGVWTLGSYLIRGAASMAGFYLVMSGCWERLLISLLGFILMRSILVRRFQPPKSIIADGRTC